ncbi:MAG: AAA family ATPase [Acidobacteriota bacterium]
MIRSLTLTNFMAHASTTMELAPGLNVLCGPNNTGKSAVVEALRCLSQNPAPRHVIRHGAKEARVEVLLDGGWRVAWIRRKAYALYEILAPGAAEPQVFAKMGRGKVPEEVAELLKMAPVSFEKGEAVDVHLGDQRHPIFLLDQPGSLLADFLASSTESAHLMAMQDLLREKTRRARIAQGNLEKATARLRHGLDLLAPLPELSHTLELLREEGRDLEARTSAVPHLEKRLSALERATAQAAGLTRRVAGLSALAEPPLLAPSARLHAAVERVEDAGRRIVRVKASLARLSQLSGPPALSGAGQLAGSLARLESLGARTRSVRASLDRLRALADPPALSPVASLARDAERIGRLGALTMRAASRVGSLSSLAAPPELGDPAPLAGLLESMQAVSARIDKGRAWLAERERVLVEKAAAISQRLAELGECPLCGSGLDPEKFLRKAGGHGTA